MKVSSCCRLKEMQQGTPGTKILALNLGQLTFQMQEDCLSQTEATSR